MPTLSKKNKKMEKKCFRLPDLAKKNQNYTCINPLILKWIFT